ncbi:MAG: VOC family protein [Chloroflexi bacterium]|nr:MAG: VOC family protein [Chloroflexota bacterium]TMC27609.1 MAG: VOC family protein [Chloroflexota bacterium]TMC32228.1 MAG: VOC family protein [Chloroflexota bacterium]TMC59049.1 MAG: VOC family protein [Chloroflexota bacterium]
MKIMKVDSVTFPVKDYAKSAKWYSDTLGLPEIWRMEEQKAAGLGVGDNSATINLFQESGPAQLIMQVERVDDARKELERKGVRFDAPTRALEGIGMFAEFRDPDGNRIALLDYTIEHGESSG